MLRAMSSSLLAEKVNGFPVFYNKSATRIAIGQCRCHWKSARIQKSFSRSGHFTNLSKDRLMFLYRIVLLSFAKSSSITLLLPNLKRSRAPFQKCARETTHPLLLLLAVYFWGYGKGMKEKDFIKDTRE